MTREPPGLEQKLNVGKCITEDNLSVIGKESIGTQGNFVLPNIKKGGQFETLMSYSCQAQDLLWYGAAIMDSGASHLQELQDLYLSNWNRGMR